MQMMSHENQKDTRRWLNERTLNDETIERFSLTWNEKEITIPVFNVDGKHLFNKYRRSPFINDENIPKYRYEFGSSRVLYNAQTLKDADPKQTVMIVEGELDVLALENIGIKAVSSTGGAGTFEPDWVEYFKGLENVIICFDNDKAGAKGAIKVQSLIPRARMLFLPSKYGKDVTDFLMRSDKQELVSLNVYQIYIPQELTSLGEKSEVRKKLKDFRDSLNIMQQVRRTALANRENVGLMDIVNLHLNERYSFYKKLERTKNNTYHESGSNKDLVLAAKQVPINTIIMFNNSGSALCVDHADTKPSMVYNDMNSKFPNTVKCYSCGFMGDAIDVVMKDKECDFKTAVKILTNQEL